MCRPIAGKRSWSPQGGVHPIRSAKACLEPWDGYGSNNLESRSGMAVQTNEMVDAHEASGVPVAWCWRSTGKIERSR